MRVEPVQYADFHTFMFLSLLIDNKVIDLCFDLRIYRINSYGKSLYAYLCDLINHIGKPETVC